MNRRGERSGLPFTKKNWTVLFIGLLTIVLGYIFLKIPPAESFWSLTVAPVFLVAGYCVIIPIAILMGGRGKKK